MRRLTQLLLIFCLGFALKAQLKEYTLEEAVKLSHQTAKKTLIYVYTDWCSLCELNERVNFNKLKIIDYINKNLFFVSINADTKDTLFFKGIPFAYDTIEQKNPLLDFLLKAQYKFPAFVVLNEKGEVLSRVYGYMEAKEMLAYLRFIVEEHYRFSTWNDYKKVALTD